MYGEIVVVEHKCEKNCHCGRLAPKRNPKKSIMTKATTTTTTTTDTRLPRLALLSLPASHLGQGEELEGWTVTKTASGEKRKRVDWEVTPSLHFILFFFFTLGSNANSLPFIHLFSHWK
jgi:hypothetical protein